MFVFSLSSLCSSTVDVYPSIVICAYTEIDCSVLLQKYRLGKQAEKEFSDNSKAGIHLDPLIMSKILYISIFFCPSINMLENLDMWTFLMVHHVRPDLVLVLYKLIGYIIDKEPIKYCVSYPRFSFIGDSLIIRLQSVLVPFFLPSGNGILVPRWAEY